MSDSESNQSDIVIKSALPKKKVKLPTSPDDNLKNNSKKGTTKTMIHEALSELKTRKGVSLHAIKKYLIEKHSVNTEKINFLIKKTINSGVKDGSIIQLKGIGASGSFKLAPEKVKAKPKSKEKKPEKMKKEKKTEQEKPKKEKKIETGKTKKDKKTEPESKIKNVKPKKADEKPLVAKKASKIEKKKEIKPTKEIKEKANKKEKVSKKEKIIKSDKKTKMVASQTPAQRKAASIKIRRSIGNIIKPPKMNPKASKA